MRCTFLDYWSAFDPLPLAPPFHKMETFPFPGFHHHGFLIALLTEPNAHSWAIKYRSCWLRVQACYREPFFCLFSVYISDLLTSLHCHLFEYANCVTHNQAFFSSNEFQDFSNNLPPLNGFNAWTAFNFNTNKRSKCLGSPSFFRSAFQFWPLSSTSKHLPGLTLWNI